MATRNMLDESVEENVADESAESKVVITVFDLLQGIELGEVQQERAAKIVRAAFAALGNRIVATERGVLELPVLGTFRVRKGEMEKGGQRIPTRQVVFKRAKPKVPQAKAPKADSGQAEA